MDVRKQPRTPDSVTYVVPLLYSRRTDETLCKLSKRANETSKVIFVSATTERCNTYIDNNNNNEARR